MSIAMLTTYTKLHSQSDSACMHTVSTSVDITYYILHAVSGVPPTTSQSTEFGGRGGRAFDDKNDNIVGIIGMRIRSGNQIDSIQVTYRLKDGSIYEAPRHGGTGGSESSFTLADGEVLVRMEGMTNGVLVDMLTFYSNFNNRYGPYGVTGLVPFSVEGLEIVAFFGRAGNLLDAVGVYISGWPDKTGISTGIIITHVNQEHTIGLA